MITKNVDGNNISQAFIDQIRSDSPNVLAKLMLNGSELSCDITSLQVTKGSCGSTELTLGNVIGDMLTASVKNLSTAIKGEDIECYIGAWTGADYEFISLGVFTVTEARKTRYTTEISAYSSVVGKTSDLYEGDNSAPSIAELGNNIATLLGCTITVDSSIDTTQIVHADVLNATIYQCLQALALCSGGYIVNDNAGNILVKRYDSTPTLSVDTGMMVRLPEVDEAPVEIRSVKCNGEYPYSAQIAFLADEQDRNIVDQSENLIFGYDTADNADVQFNCDYMTDEVFNANIVGVIGYSYWHATVGLTLGDPRLEGVDVLAVTDVDGTVYSVPCHQITHSYSGGFKSDISSAQPTQQQNDIGSQTPLGATQELAFQAYMGNKKTGQFLWFVGDGDDEGLHITSEPKDDFISDPSGGNLLARSDGLIMRDGLTDKAKFGVDEVTVGEPDSSHILITSTGMKLYGEDAENAGATIESGKVVLGGNGNEGGQLVVYDEDNNQVVLLNSDGISAIAGQIGSFNITDTELRYYDVDSDVLVVANTNGFSTRRKVSNTLYLGSAFSQGVIELLGSTSSLDDLESQFEIYSGFIGSYPRFVIRDEFNEVDLCNYRGDEQLTDWNGDFRVWGDLSCTGAKPREVSTKNYNVRRLYCYETPTPLFGDIGEALLDESGICYVDIDDIFSETIASNMEYQVFLQKEGDGDCYIAEKTKRYFVIKGTPNLKVAWELKAKQRDYEYLRLEESNGYEAYAKVDDIYDYIEEQERLLYG